MASQSPRQRAPKRPTLRPLARPAGDIAYAHKPAAARHLRVEHWGEADAMGEIVGANLAGEHLRWAVAPGFWSTRGDHQLKYSAWGDGFDRAHLVEGPEGWATSTAELLRGETPRAALVCITSATVRLAGEQDFG